MLKTNSMLLKIRSLSVAAWIVLSGVCLSGVCLMGGCKKPESTLHDPVRIVCSTGPVGDLIKNIGGDHVEVVTLMGAGVDPHGYTAKPEDRRHLDWADVVVYNGLHLEGRMDDVFKSQAQIKPTFAITDGINENSDERLLDPDNFAGKYDPHIWFDPLIWVDCVRHASKKLCEIDSAHADDYRKNADAYIEKIKQLHTWCEKQIEQLSSEQRVLVTAHDAFRYFGKAYGFRVRGLQGISSDDKPDFKRINSLTDMLVRDKIAAVFFESSVPKRRIAPLLRQCASRGHTVVIGGELYSDALGPTGSPAATYIGMVRYNITTIVDALADR